MIRIDDVFLYKFSKKRVWLFARIIIMKDFKEIKLDFIFKIFY